MLQLFLRTSSGINSITRPLQTETGHCFPFTELQFSCVFEQIKETRWTLQGFISKINDQPAIITNSNNSTILFTSVIKQILHLGFFNTKYRRRTVMAVFLIFPFKRLLLSTNLVGYFKLGYKFVQKSRQLHFIHGLYKSKCPFGSIILFTLVAYNQQSAEPRPLNIITLSQSFCIHQIPQVRQLLVYLEDRMFGS